MAKHRKGRRPRQQPKTVSYTDEDGNVLVLRESLSGGAIGKIRKESGNAASTEDDVWHRRMEMLFERLTVSWEIAGLPLDDQAMLLARFRIADGQTQAWVRQTIAEHLERHIPELAGL